jgi:transcriptional regulator GlxA family with amidase domain
VRVYHARDLRLPIAEAAMRTGFADSAPSAQRHLHRHFKRIIGVTPGQYRKHVQDR